MTYSSTEYAILLHSVQQTIVKHGGQGRYLAVMLRQQAVPTLCSKYMRFCFPIQPIADCILISPNHLMFGAVVGVCLLRGFQFSPDAFYPKILCYGACIL